MLDSLKYKQRHIERKLIDVSFGIVLQSAYMSSRGSEIKFSRRIFYRDSVLRVAQMPFPWNTCVKLASHVCCSVSKFFSIYVVKSTYVLIFFEHAEQHQSVSFPFNFFEELPTNTQYSAHLLSNSTRTTKDQPGPSWSKSGLSLIIYQ